MHTKAEPIKSKTAAQTPNRHGAGQQPFFSPQRNGNASDTSEPLVQAKLTIGQPNDKYEQEADAVADQVVQRLAENKTAPATGETTNGEAMPAIQRLPITPIQRTAQSPIAPARVQAKCATCGEEEKLQKKDKEEPEIQSKPRIKSTAGSDETPPEPPADPAESTSGTIRRKPIFDSSAEDGALQRSTLPGAGSWGMVQMKCAACAAEEKESVQRSGDRPATATPDFSSRLSASKGGGSPLPKDVSTSMGNAMGADFSGVRVHTGSEAAGMSQSIQAQAFTHGSDVYFNEGKYDPGSGEGKRLLAHELVHTVQQGGVRRKVTNPQVPEKNNDKTSVEPPNVQKFDLPGAGLARNAWNYISSTSNQVVSGASNLVSNIREGIGEGIDFLRNIINDGISWLTNSWNQIKELVSTGLESITNFFQNIAGFLAAPFQGIYHAIVDLNPNGIRQGFERFKSFVTSIWLRFKTAVSRVVQGFMNFWERIGGFVGRLFSRVRVIIENRLFRILPDFLQNIGRNLIRRITQIWQNIQNWWSGLKDRAISYINRLLNSIGTFVQGVLSFAIDRIIDIIQKWGPLLKALFQSISNPWVLLKPLGKQIVGILGGAESRFEGETQKRISGNNSSEQATSSATGIIQRDSTGEDPTGRGTRRVAHPVEVAVGLVQVMKEKWRTFSLWDMVKGFFEDLFMPWRGNGRDYDKLKQDISNVVSNPLRATSLHEFWTSFLKIGDIVNLILLFVVNVVMRSLGLILIILGLVPSPALPFAHAIGIGLLIAFVALEASNLDVNRAILLTGLTDDKEKEERYNRIADSIIALVITGLMLLLIWLASKLASAIKGMIQRRTVTPPAEGTVPKTESPVAEGESTRPAGESVESESPSKPNEAESPGSGEPNEPLRPGEHEVPSKDGRRRIRMTEEGVCEVCASPCEPIRRKHNIQQGSPADIKLREITSGFEGMTPEQQARVWRQLVEVEQQIKNGSISTKIPLPNYENPGPHDPSNRGPNRFNRTKSVLPENHLQLWEESILGSDGNRWTKVGRGNGAEYHRFQNDGNGNWHWNGSTNGRLINGEPRIIPLSQVPSDIINM